MTRRPPAPEAHLRQDRPEVAPSSGRYRAFPIGDPARPRGDPEAILAYLDVERSPRYRPAGARTFCNVYACDYCYLAGLYLPRVWWTAEALERMAVGERPAARYGETVRELSANALFDWLRMHGPDHGWAPAATLDELQRGANGGGVGLIVARHRNARRSGHIAVVIPERPDRRAQRRNALVVLPLQSQAGRVNRAASSGESAWWDGDWVRDRGFWLNARTRA